MKKEEKIKSMVSDLLNLTKNEENKTNATIILSAFDREDGENTGFIVAACGNIVAITAILAHAMHDSEELRTAIHMAAKFDGMMGSDPQSPRNQLAALLASKLAKKQF